MILTASDSDSDTIQGLKAGANDYITKPFRFGVLMARIDAHLLNEAGPTRLCYAGSVLRAVTSTPGATREVVPNRRTANGDAGERQ